ncbi:ATP-binding protein [Umezawaea sp.]|uniref:ATP-binding protein n=1 Tax=Umezawaea sp. TaxID=1955258 RepID=UPI002ED18AC4
MTELRDGVGVTAPTRRMSLASRPESVEVRRWTRGTLSAHVDTYTLVDVLLIVGELVGNAYRHTSSPRELRVTSSGVGVLIEVEDGDVDHPREMAVSADDWGGRGIQVLIELAASWGVRVEGGGKVVWALLSHGEGPAPRPG